MSKRPVAFRWKNVADVWCLSKDEEHAAAMSGGDYQGLYVRDGTPWGIDPDIDHIVSVALGANWRPIETAPRDGTRFLGWWHGFGTSIIHRNDPGGEARNPKNHRECWVDDGGYPFSGKHLTHWMPLPSAPSDPDAEYEAIRDDR